MIAQQSLPPFIIQGEIDRLNRSIEIRLQEAEDRILNLLTGGIYELLQERMER